MPKELVSSSVTTAVGATLRDGMTLDNGWTVVGRLVRLDRVGDRSVDGSRTQAKGCIRPVTTAVGATLRDGMTLDNGATASTVANRVRP